MSDDRRKGRRLKVREGESVRVRKKVKEDRSRRVRVKVQVALKVRTSLRVKTRKRTWDGRSGKGESKDAGEG